MNRQLFVLLIVALPVMSAEVCFADPTTLTGITHEYRFDDGGGTTAADSVGSVQASLGAFGAGNSQWIVGKFGGGVNFTNEDAYVITDSPLGASSANQFSVSFWSRLNSKPNSNDSELLTPQTANWITINPTGNTNGQGKKGVGVGSVRVLAEPVLNTWENYVITYDRPSDTVSVYRDGVLRDTGTVDLPSLDTQWVFGHNQGLGNTNGSFHGALDEIQFYDRVLAASEVATLANPLSQQGDYNRSGSIDAADYVVWRNQVGQIVPACSGADANCDTFVAVGEYQPWRENFGRSTSGSAVAVANVPEPASLLLVVLGILAIAVSGVRKRDRQYEAAADRG